MSCSHGHQIHEELYIPVTKSSLYVRLIGNAEKPLIVNFHGSRGAFSSLDHKFSRKHLEDDYLITYLDKRGGGKSEATSDSTLFTMGQIVEDLDGVINSLQRRKQKVNLIGLSWGHVSSVTYDRAI